MQANPSFAGRLAERDPVQLPDPPFRVKFQYWPSGCEGEQIDTPLHRRPYLPEVPHWIGEGGFGQSKLANATPDGLHLRSTQSTNDRWQRVGPSTRTSRVVERPIGKEDVSRSPGLGGRAVLGGQDRDVHGEVIRDLDRIVRERSPWRRHSLGSKAPPLNACSWSIQAERAGRESEVVSCRDSSPEDR